MAGSNETDAAAASLCAREVAAQAERLGVEPAIRLNEFPGWTRKLALGVFLVSITYYAITLVWWFARRKHYLIRKRGSLFMLLTAFGLINSEIAVLLRVYMGISTFSCDLYHWRLVAMSLIVAPIVTRLILHANGSRFNTMLLERGKRDIAFEEYRDLTVANASRVFLFTFCGMCHRGRRRRPHTRRARLERRESIGSQAIDSETEDELEDQHRAQSRHEANDGRAQSQAHLKHSHHHRATVDIEEGGSREGSGQVPPLSQRGATPRAAGKSRTLRALTFDEQQLLVAYYKTTNVYGLMLAGGFALAPVTYTVSTMLRENSPYGGKGCQGCLGSALDVLVLAITFGVMLVIGCNVIAQTQSGDALGVVAELRKCMGLSVMTAVATAIVMADPGELQRRRIFPLDMIVVPFLMMIHFVQCPLQVYRTKCPLLNWLANCKVQAPKNGGQGAPSESIHHRTIGSGKSSRAFVTHSSSFSRSMRAPPPSPSTISPSRNALESSDDVSCSRTISCTMTSSTRLTSKPSLEEVLESAEGRQAFVRQLSREHSIESYYLLDAVQRYRVMQEQHPSSPLVLDMVFKIYRTFIADNSILQVNVSWNVSRELARAVAALSESEAQVQEPAGDLFDGVLGEVIEMMRRDSFQRFLLSDLSQDYLRRRRTRLCHAATA